MSCPSGILSITSSHPYYASMSLRSIACQSRSSPSLRQPVNPLRRECSISHTPPRVSQPGFSGPLFIPVERVWGDHTAVTAACVADKFARIGPGISLDPIKSAVDLTTDA